MFTGESAEMMLDYFHRVVIYQKAASYRLSSSCICISQTASLFSFGSVGFSSQSDHPFLFQKTENRLYNLFWVCRSKFWRRSWGNARVPLNRGSPFVFARGPLWVWEFSGRAPALIQQPPPACGTPRDSPWVSPADHPILQGAAPAGIARLGLSWSCDFAKRRTPSLS